MRTVRCSREPLAGDQNLGLLIKRRTMPLKQNTIHIVFASDANYAMPLTVALCSAASNCNRTRSLVFHVIHSGIEPLLQKRVESSLAKVGFPDARIQWIVAPFDMIEGLKLTKAYLSALTYAKLLLPHLIPGDVTKVLYLDSDLVVRDDLADLWDTDLGDKVLFAVRDRIAWVSGPRGLANYRELGIPPDAKYFNAGLLLVNLAKWREKNISERIFTYLRTHRAIIKMEDQEGLNAVLFDDWGELPFRWNWQIAWRLFRTGKKKMDWVPDDSKKSIVHFTTAEKPWLPACDVEEKQDFFWYLDRTEWAGWRVSFLKEIYARFWRSIEDARRTAGAFRQELLLRARTWAGSTRRTR
jgi:lipopolysaccharide biosynthesis glycosyltransferase